MMFWTDHDAASLSAWLADRGHKPSHAPRLLRSFYAGDGDAGFADLDLPKSLRPVLNTELLPRRSSIAARTVAGDGTTKLLLALPDGAAVETVLMPDAFRPDRAAGCASSQVGCAMGCDFCASTKRGLERNLAAGEIVEQFLSLRAEARRLGRKLQTLVFMGMGEPMHNLAEVLAAVRRIAGGGMGELGWRQVTVSTVGIVPGIDALAASGLNVHLALSLHAPDDATRAAIVPSNRRYPVADVAAAARRYQDRTNRIVTIEYCLLAGVNDSDEQAELLAALVRGWRAHVNLIPYNATGPGVSGRCYDRPTVERVAGFLGILRDRGVVAHVRRTRGDDAAAACGQLRETYVALGA